MNFFAKALGIQQPARPQHWNAPQAAPAAPQAARGYGGYQPPPGLAVAPPASAQDSELAQHIADTGYIKKPPEWVRKQPTDQCPECGSNDFIINSLNERGLAPRCMSCGYIAGRPGLQPHAGDLSLPSSGSTVSATRQSHGLGKNFFKIEGRIE